MSRFIGDKQFYKTVLGIAAPIMIQNGISNFVNLLDNLMVGQLGTEPMSGVAIVNQIMFIYFLCIFGGLAGAGIYTAQYFGSRNEEGIRQTFRFKIWLGFILTALSITLLYFQGDNLISLYLNEGSEGSDLAATLEYGSGYMRILFFGLPFLFMNIAYSSTIRECGKTVLPMVSGIIAVFVNLIFNWLLIFGNLGFPELGVKGAAIATDISRAVEFLVLLIWVHSHGKVYPYIKGLYRTMLVPFDKAVKFMATGTPLLLNETLWSIGMFLLNRSYSLRGLNVVAGQNISSTVNNVFNIAFIAMGDAVAIIIGRLLGAGKLEEARDKDRKMIAFAVFLGFVIMALVLLTSTGFPELYNTNAEAKLLATRFLIVQAVATPKDAFLHTTYFTLRSGGRTIITFIFDSVFMFAVSVPAATLMISLTGLGAVTVFAIIHSLDLIKCIIGFIMIKKGIWVRNIVADKS